MSELRTSASQRSTSEVVELLAGWGPHLDHGLACRVDELFRPRRLRALYPCPVHGGRAKRIDVVDHEMSEYTCALGHTFIVRRRPWPKGDSYWWQFNNMDDGCGQEIESYVATWEKRRFARLHEIGVATRAVAIAIDDLNRDNGQHPAAMPVAS